MTDFTIRFAAVVTAGLLAFAHGARAEEAKLTPPLPFISIGVDPAVAAPNVRRKIIVSGIWPTGCPPTSAYVSTSPNYTKAALGIVLLEPLTLIACTTVLAPYRFELDYTPTAVGQMEVVVMAQPTGYLGRGTLVTSTISAPRALRDVSGAWYDPQTNGSGMMIAHDFGGTDEVFITWEVYDTGGIPRWYTIQGARWSPDGTTMGGLLYETRAGTQACPTCPVPMQAITSLEFVTLTFSVDGANGGLNAAMYRLTPNGPSQIANLRRFLPNRIVVP